MFLLKEKLQSYQQFTKHLFNMTQEYITELTTEYMTGEREYPRRKRTDDWADTLEEANS